MNNFIICQRVTEYMYLYAYIYVCVCVCVCETATVKMSYKLFLSYLPLTISLSYVSTQTGRFKLGSRK